MSNKDKVESIRAGLLYLYQFSRQNFIGVSTGWETFLDSLLEDAKKYEAAYTSDSGGGHFDLTEITDLVDKCKAF